MLSSLFTDPGYTALIESGDWAGLFAAWHGEKNLLVKFGSIISSAVDSGNTPTTTLRAGSVLGIVSASGLYNLYDADETNGLQIPRAILPFQLDMMGPLGVVVQKSVPLLVRANLLVAELHNQDANVLKVLSQMGCNLDEPAGAQALQGPLGFVEKAANYTVVAADNGICFMATTGAVNFTLPTIANGLTFEFLSTVNADMAILSAGSSDNIVHKGDLGADSVTFSTANEKIGSHARVRATYIGGALKWVLSNLGGTTATVA